MKTDAWGLPYPVSSRNGDARRRARSDRARAADLFRPRGHRRPAPPSRPVSAPGLPRPAVCRDARGSGTGDRALRRARLHHRDRAHASRPGVRSLSSHRSAPIVSAFGCRTPQSSLIIGSASRSGSSPRIGPISRLRPAPPSLGRHDLRTTWAGPRPAIRPRRLQARTGLRRVRPRRGKSAALPPLQGFRREPAGNAFRPGIR